MLPPFPGSLLFIKVLLMVLLSYQHCKMEVGEYIMLDHTVNNYLL